MGTRKLCLQTGHLAFRPANLDFTRIANPHSHRNAMIGSAACPASPPASAGPEAWLVSAIENGSAVSAAKTSPVPLSIILGPVVSGPGPFSSAVDVCCPRVAPAPAPADPMLVACAENTCGTGDGGAGAIVAGDLPGEGDGCIGAGCVGAG